MMTYRLTVQTTEGVWQGDVDPWTSFVVLAARSAEPESFAELAAAVRRYQPDHQLFEEHRPPGGPWGAAAPYPWCVIDLAGRTVVAGEGFELPDPLGAYEADEDEPVEGFRIVWLTTPPDWLFREGGDDWEDDWRKVVAARAAARASALRSDARAVLFGRALLEHLAAGVLAHVDDGLVSEDRQGELTRAIHADWLMAARADLDGRTPREVLLADRKRISLDLDRRAQQWSLQGRAAPALPPDAPAYRLGGFGTTEVVLYFDLVRALLAEAWEQARQEPRPTQPELVEWLAEFRDLWLHQPGEATGYSMTPAELIESERRRMPVTSDGSHLDCDCPLCQAVAEGEFGPAFRCFDGHHLEMEDEFAFSLCATREEWDRDQEEYRRFSEEMDRKERERAANESEDEGPFASSVWRSSFVDWDAFGGPGASPQGALLALTFPLAELVSDLEGREGGVALLKALNRAYGALRTTQEEAERDSAAQEVRDLLEEASRRFPDLTPRCADLQSRLDEVLRLS